ncbi:hypothetical protein AY599_05285 [Leptolyngbya valderiana BDU 20041]|nr:hypothetical protein [Geitlerinema sp. CS-897]OAB55241.1 hypothetical protein AY599_05285 [Leptolyngbya valderiana BDU 20041]PPT08080.1 hypothetical protein CKA32_001842 [Geitlerinema sp. FC II]
MKPKFTSQLAWHQAQALMQPALIRILDNLRKLLEQSSWKGTYHEIQVPIPGYQLRLERNGSEKTIDIWELCYQVCFLDYQPTHTPNETQEVEIDTSLFDGNEIDWERLDEKAKAIARGVFGEE